MKSSDKKKILVFIDWYLPGYRAGGGQRAFANLVAWLREDFDFYIITRNTDFLEIEPYKDVKTDEWNELAKEEKVYYASENNIGFQLFSRLFKEVNPDYAYINGIYSPKFSILPLILMKWKRFNGIVVLGTYGMLAPTAIQIKQQKKKLFLKLGRFLGLYRNIRFHATSEQEVNDIKAVFGNRYEVQAAPHLPVKEFPAFGEIVKRSGELRLISVARISPEKNTLYALKCLKGLKINEGKVLFDLYGPVYDQEYWQECLKLMEDMPKGIEVNYKGIINGDEVIDTIGQYHLLFMPTRGENFGYVILESFMAGRPVLISDKTPWKGLIKKSSGFDLPLEVQEGFVEVISGKMNIGQEEFNELCKGAQAEAKRFMDNPDLKEMNRRLFA